MIRRKNIFFFSIFLFVVVPALAFFLFSKSNAVRTFARPFIADNIILIQNIRKLSDVLFLPQVVFGSNELPHYELRIKAKDLAKLEGALPKGDYTEIEEAGLVFNALSGDRKKRVDATLVYEGREYGVRVGYRGTSYDHWYFPKKSWHIKFRDELPLGLSEIDLIIPRDRDYLGEELNHFRSRKLGLFVPESEFVSLSLNGGGASTYWLVEDWSEEILAAHGLSGCLFGAQLLEDEEDKRNVPFYRLDAWKEYTDCGAAGETKLAALLSILELSDVEFPRAAEKLLDIEKVLRWEAAARLAGSHHAYGYNMRVFWNAETEKFEFVPWDFGLSLLGSEIDSPYNEFITRLLGYEKYISRRNEILATYIGASENTQGDLAYYDSLLQKTRSAFYGDRLKTESILEFNKKVAIGRDAITRNIEMITTVLGGGITPLASTSGRIEYEEKLGLPVDIVEKVWEYLKNDLGSGADALTTRVEVEQFNDVYFDTRALTLLEQNAGVRYRVRGREDKEPLVQIKAGEGSTRGEWKFSVKNNAAVGTHITELLKKKERDDFAVVLASLGVDANLLNPTLELSQERRRIYFSEDGEDVFTISLDLAKAVRLWANAEFAEIEVEINEIAYTNADEAHRTEFRATAEKIAKDITERFPEITHDLAPKYNKAFNALSKKIPFYKFLIGIGIF